MVWNAHVTDPHGNQSDEEQPTAPEPEGFSIESEYATRVRTHRRAGQDVQEEGTIEEHVETGRLEGRSSFTILSTRPST